MINSNDLLDRLKRAVAFYWQTREAQRQKQTDLGNKDQGARSAVTGGAQMNEIKWKRQFTK